MEKRNIYTLIALAILTITTAIFSHETAIFKYAALIILVLSAFKFWLVAFQFMELKKAAGIWKTLIILIGLLFIVAVGSVLMVG